VIFNQQSITDSPDIYNPVSDLGSGGARVAEVLGRRSQQEEGGAGCEVASGIHGRPCQGAEIAIPLRCPDDPLSPLPLTDLGLKYQIGRNEETAISRLQFPDPPESSLKNVKLGLQTGRLAPSVLLRALLLESLHLLLQMAPPGPLDTKYHVERRIFSDTRGREHLTFNLTQTLINDWCKTLTAFALRINGAKRRIDPQVERPPLVVSAVPLGKVFPETENLLPNMQGLLVLSLPGLKFLHSPKPSEVVAIAHATNRVHGFIRRARALAGSRQPKI